MSPLRGVAVQLLTKLRSSVKYVKRLCRPVWRRRQTDSTARQVPGNVATLARVRRCSCQAAGPSGPGRDRRRDPTGVGGTHGGGRGSAGDRAGRRGGEPLPRPDADGGLAGLAHRLLVPGRRLPGDGDVRRVARSPHRRRRAARARPHVGQGDGRALRRGCGVGHAAHLRDGHPVARPDEHLRGDLRVPVRARGLLVLHRGDLRRDLPVRLEPPVAARAHPVRRADDPRRHGGHVLRRRRERLDEQPRRLRRRPGRHADERRPDRAACSPRRCRRR